jgi:hypothetical protein
MSHAEIPSSKIAKVLAEAASRVPGITTSIACAGTALESKTFVVSNKTLLFLGSKEARLKLNASIDEAKKMSMKFGDIIRVGSGGWVAIRLRDGPELSATCLRRWVKESHGLFKGASKKRS